MKKINLTIILFFTAIFITFFLAPVDTDLGWHLRYGNFFLENGHPMIKNKLSVLLHDQPWPNSYILYHPLVAVAYRISGFWGLTILNAVTMTISFIFVWLILNKNIVKTFMVSLITSLGGWTILRYGLRAQITSILFLCLLFYILEKVNQTKHKLILLGLLFLVWANFHGSYLYGIILTSLWSLLEFQPYLSIPVFITPLINPFGLNNYRYVLKTMFSPLNTMIAEWTTPQLFFKIISLSVFLIYIGLWFRKNKFLGLKKLFWPLASLSSLYLVLNARRNLPQFFLITSIGLVKLIKFPKKIKPIINIFSTTILGLSAILILPKTIKINSSWQNYCRLGMTHYPCSAIDYIKENKLQGNIFNFYRWGGFLSWQLPDNLIFVAGHIPANQLPSGKYPYQLHLEILQAQPEYQDKLDKYNIDYILIPPNTFLDLELQENKTKLWKEIYRDKISALYKRLE